MHAPRAALFAFAVFCGCARGAEMTPMIPISTGYAERIALMDRYGLHDEDRKRMMKRPRVWVEEVPDEPAPDAADAAPEGPRESDAAYGPESRRGQNGLQEACRSRAGVRAG